MAKTKLYSTDGTFLLDNSTGIKSRIMFFTLPRNKFDKSKARVWLTGVGFRGSVEEIVGAQGDTILKAVPSNSTSKSLGSGCVAITLDNGVKVFAKPRGAVKSNPEVGKDYALVDRLSELYNEYKEFIKKNDHSAARRAFSRVQEFANGLALERAAFEYAVGKLGKNIVNVLGISPIIVGPVMNIRYEEGNDPNDLVKQLKKEHPGYSVEVDRKKRRLKVFTNEGEGVTIQRRRRSAPAEVEPTVETKIPERDEAEILRLMASNEYEEERAAAKRQVYEQAVKWANKSMFRENPRCSINTNPSPDGIAHVDLEKSSNALPEGVINIYFKNGRFYCPRINGVGDTKSEIEELIRFWANGNGVFVEDFHWKI